MYKQSKNGFFHVPRMMVRTHIKNDCCFLFWQTLERCTLVPFTISITTQYIKQHKYISAIIISSDNTEYSHISSIFSCLVFAPFLHHIILDAVETVQRLSTVFAYAHNPLRYSVGFVLKNSHNLHSPTRFFILFIIYL